MIITLTLNPAFDIHCVTDNFRIGHESFFNITSKDAGGKGINISRALNALNVENRAIVVVGKENGDEYCRQLKETGVNYAPVFVDGRIRENYILHDETGVETRVSFNGFSVDKTLFNKVIKLIDNSEKETILTVTGSLPKGISVSEVKEFLKNLKARSATKIVIDSRSFSLSDLLEVKPFLIKPNKDEIISYVGKEVNGLNDTLQIAETIRKKGVENVVVSAGEEGAVLACDDGLFSIVPPPIKAVSTIGAGDSMVAGFIYAYVCGKNKPECLKYAVSFGTAACLQKGTLPPEKKDIINIANSLNY